MWNSVTVIQYVFLLDSMRGSVTRCHCHTLCLSVGFHERECDTVSLSYSMSLSVGFHERECDTVSLSYSMSLSVGFHDRECDTVSPS